jgi:hypothetical protein
MDEIIKCNCGTRRTDRTFSAKYDAYFCPICDTWLEPKCNDDNCVYCVNRPKKPSQMEMEIKE